MPIDKDGINWSRYEYAVLERLERLDEFQTEVRGFMSEVRAILAAHACHPERLDTLEEGHQKHGEKLAVMAWKVGAIGVGAATLIYGLAQYLFSNTALGSIL